MTFEENIGNICIINGETVEKERLDIYKSEKYKAFYEVIRIIKGIPLFYDDHFSRLKSSMNKASYELVISKKDLRDQLQEVCKLNYLSDCNVKVIVLQYGAEQITIAFINKFYYPAKQEYDNGVECCTVNLMRSNPNIKMINTGYKEEIKRVSEEKNVFEVLLVNDSGKITEGGKSNAFFVKGNKIYTSPEDYVLVGITRKYVVDVCKKLGYEVIETLIGIDSLTSFDAVFITGTSINVLPVRVIDDFEIDSAKNATTQHVMVGYNSIISSYINDN
ncbi:branched-chain amino acid aminotransferase [Ruminiclostridium sufflavum DSM 19573]|uniref:Branched-chain amino acid aminotransferase n=1 Tax=Ruminiclostridium sufflavum DSM 19573 TaxID=1121337 RepID=A0A318XNQ8_9FIRM|nr:aminotransferase class IV [Ruminiclostridium sufflavum]PYG87642.1 branched-chain amino acid aminotransferase [Ruminiclostridium sufflavum DSM 19573]